MRQRPLFLLLIIHIACIEYVGAQDLQNMKNAKPFALHGGISAGLNTYSNFTKDSLSNTSFGSNPSYFLQFNPVISIYGYNIPINFMITSQNKSLNTPFTRF